MGVCMYGYMGVYMYGCMYAWVHGCMSVCVIDVRFTVCIKIDK